MWFNRPYSRNLEDDSSRWEEVGHLLDKSLRRILKIYLPTPTTNEEVRKKSKHWIHQRASKKKEVDLTLVTSSEWIRMLTRALPLHRFLKGEGEGVAHVKRGEKHRWKTSKRKAWKPGIRKRSRLQTESTGNNRLAAQFSNRREGRW